MTGRDSIRETVTLVAVALAIGVATSDVAAQSAPELRNLNSERVLLSIDSGVHSASVRRGAQRVFEHFVEVPDARWLRVRFGDAHLGEGSYIRIESIEDGGVQRLTSIGLQRWRSASAFFNGSAVRISLHLAPGDEGVFFRVDMVDKGPACFVGAPKPE